MIELIAKVRDEWTGKTREVNLHFEEGNGNPLKELQDWLQYNNNQILTLELNGELETDLAEWLEEDEDEEEDEED